MTRWLVGVLMIGVVDAAAADERLTLASVIEQAVAANPEIVAAQKRADAAATRPAQERGLADPMVSAGYRSSGNPLPGAGLGVEPIANIGLMVSQALPYPGTRALRVELAAREAKAEHPLVDAARLSVIARVKQSYYRLAYTYLAAEVLARNQALLDTLLKVSEGRYAVGQAAQQDVIKAQTELSIIELRTRRLHQERVAREAELNALLNRPASSSIDRPEDLELVAFDHPLPALVDLALARAPMLDRDRLMIDAASAGVDLARTNARPEFTLAGGYAYMGSMPPMFEVRFDVNIPLRHERRQAAIAQQVASLDAARRNYDANRLRLQASLEEDYQMGVTALDIARLYRDTVLPQARLALESSMVSYQNGAVDFLSVLTNFGSVLEYEISYVDELTTFHVAASRIEEMTGAPLMH
jgi:cobalt-zinc-cadmium efflux system outer membrane protein